MRSNIHSMVTLLIACALVSACGSRNTTVRDASSAIYKSSTIRVVDDTAKRGVQVEDRYRLEFETALKDRLGRVGFTDGGGLLLKYWFTDADEGSRTTRWLVGFGVGSGKLQVAVEYYDVNGNKLAETDNVGTVKGGFTGGSFSKAILNSAIAIATYTQKSFFSKDAAHVPATTKTTRPGQPTPNTASAPLPAPTAPAATPVPGLKTWQMAVNTNPPGAIIKAYDENQKLYQIGKSPAGFLWPLQTQADAIVVVWQGRQVSLLPTFLESISVDFSQQPPVVKGGTVIDGAPK